MRGVGDAGFEERVMPLAALAAQADPFPRQAGGDVDRMHVATRGGHVGEEHGAVESSREKHAGCGCFCHPTCALTDDSLESDTLSTPSAFSRPASPMYSVTKRLEFCYGHRLLDYDGICAHPHGHNAVVEIEAQSDRLDGRNMVCDFSDVK
mgnify:CR=1 FL=1